MGKDVYCIDCIHCDDNKNCLRKAKKDGFNLVTGEQVYKNIETCSYERSVGLGNCGLKGRFFEPKG